MFDIGGLNFFGDIYMYIIHNMCAHACFFFFYVCTVKHNRNF